MNPTIILVWKFIFHCTKNQIKSFTKPYVGRIIIGALSYLTRSRADLIAENALLRQQLIIINRQIKRPQLTNRDRVSLVLLARCTQFWKQAVFIIQPDTLLRWHRASSAGFPGKLFPKKLPNFV
jgi:putative transposase